MSQLQKTDYQLHVLCGTSDFIVHSDPDHC